MTGTSWNPKTQIVNIQRRDPTAVRRANAPDLLRRLDVCQRLAPISDDTHFLAIANH